MKRKTLKQAMREQLMEEPEPTNKPITMELPLPPSVNKLYYTGDDGCRHMTTAGKRWKRTAAYEAWAAAQQQGWRMCTKSWIIIELYVWWRDDSRRRDVSNLHKVLADSLEGIIYLDDKQSLIRDMEVQKDKERPRVELRIYQKEDCGTNERIG